MNTKPPVLYIIFNRLNATKLSFGSIKEYKPTRLYIAADGPRVDNKEDISNCDEVKQFVLNSIDWECEIHTLFRNINKGCDPAITEALDWFFENEEFGIIIEDDVVLSQSFFDLAQIIDQEYHDNTKVMSINSQCLRSNMFSDSFSFSNMPNSWGWATWKRAWKLFDRRMQTYPQLKFLKYIKALGIFRGLMYKYYYWKSCYRLIQKGEVKIPWDTRWCLSILSNNGLVAVPVVNLSKNVGLVGYEGAHYNDGDFDMYAHLQLESLPNILSIPTRIEFNLMLKQIESSDFRRIRLHGLLKK